MQDNITKLSDEISEKINENTTAMHKEWQKNQKVTDDQINKLNEKQRATDDRINKLNEKINSKLDEAYGKELCTYYVQQIKNLALKIAHETGIKIEKILPSEYS